MKKRFFVKRKPKHTMEPTVSKGMLRLESEVGHPIVLPIAEELQGTRKPSPPMNIIHNRTMEKYKKSPHNRYLN